MVGLDLEVQRHRKQGGAEGRRSEPFLVRMFFQGAPVCIYDSGQHPCQKGQGHHFGIVPHLDDLQVVGAEGDCDGSADCNQPVDAKGHH